MARGAEEQLESLQGGCTVGYQGGEGAPTGSGPSGFLLRGRKCLGGHWGRRHSFWWGMRQEGPKGGDKQGSLAGGRTGRRGPSDRRAASRHREGRRADTLPTWVTPATSRWVHEAGPVTTTRPAIPVTRGAGQASLPMGTGSEPVGVWGGECKGLRVKEFLFETEMFSNWCRDGCENQLVVLKGQVLCLCCVTCASMKLAFIFLSR